MLDAAEYGKLPTDDARQHMADLASAFYSTDRWKMAFARDAGIEGRTVSTWFQGDRRPPFWAIALLEAASRALRYRGILSGLSTLLDDLRRIDVGDL